MKSKIFVATLVLVASAAFAADPVKPATPAAPAAATPAAAAVKPATGVRGDLAFWMKDAETKLVELAEATPENKYSYRPSKEARSTAEVFMHVAGANYGLPALAGVTPPAGFNHETFDKSLTKKADVIKTLKESFVHANTAFEKMTDADMEKPVDMFGNKTTVRGLYVMMLAHTHEHLGQSIAHARANKIAPPWSARQEKMFKEMKDKKAAEAVKTN